LNVGRAVRGTLHHIQAGVDTGLAKQPVLEACTLDPVGSGVVDTVGLRGTMPMTLISRGTCNCIPNAGEKPSMALLRLRCSFRDRGKLQMGRFSYSP
jgi:hypothetical protein